MLVSLCLLALFGLVSAGPTAGSSTPPGSTRRVVVVLPGGWPTARFERWAAFARREGIEIRVTQEGESDPIGWETVQLAAPPVSDAFRARLLAFPVALDSTGFVFDGRPYRAAEDAIAMTHPDRPSETVGA